MGSDLPPPFSPSGNAALGKQEEDEEEEEKMKQDGVYHTAPQCRELRAQCRGKDGRALQMKDVKRLRE